MKEKLEHFFATFKKANEVFASSDKQLFFKKSDCVAHANSLKDKSVTEYTREVIEREQKKPALKAEKNPDGNPEAGKDKKTGKEEPKKPE